MAEKQQTVEEVPIDHLPTKEYNEARDKGVITVPKTPVVEEPVPETEQTEETEQKEGEKPKQRGWNGAQKKIDRLIKHNAELEKAKEAAEKRAQELESKTSKPPEEKKPEPKADDEPKLEDFQDEHSYLRALAKWEIKQEFKAQAEAEEKAQEDAKTKEIFDNHNVKVSEARAKYEDFDESVTSTDTPWKDGSKSDVNASIAFQIAVFESGNGGEILYYLSKHRDELEKMRGLSPARVQMAVGRIADKLEAANEDEPPVNEEEPPEEPPAKEEKPKIVSKAPAPIRPVGGSSTKSSVPLDKMSPADYNKAREAGRLR